MIALGQVLGDNDSGTRPNAEEASPHSGWSILRDCMEHLGMSVAETAEHLGVIPQGLQSIINGEAGVTFSLAVGLDKLFGHGVSTWYQLQAQYDEVQECNKNDQP